MPRETHTPFIIDPADDFLSRSPHLGSLARRLSIRYIHREVVTDDHLKQLGQGLWEALDIDDALEEARRRARPRILPLVVRSDDPAILNLPWECIHHPGEGFLGRHEGFTLSRQLKTGVSGEVELPKGPLEALLFTSLPDDLEEEGRLDVEAEQENVLEALDPWIHEGRIKLTAPDDGRFSTFKELIRNHDYHLVFLSGHGRFEDNRLNDKPARSFFVFEGEDGRSRPGEAGEIARCFSGKTSIQCVALSACQLGRVSSEDLAGSMIFSLLDQGVPHVIAMRESVFDLAGILFSRAFCDALGNQDPLDVALQHARIAITRPFEGEQLRKDAAGGGAAELSYGQWCLPALYTRFPARPIIDWDFTPRPEPKKFLFNESFAGVETPLRFIGRRKELRTLVRRLERGEVRQLLLTGPGGQGKTALAGKLAKTLENRGCTVQSYSARVEEPWKTFLTNVQRILAPELAEYVDRNSGKCPTPEARARLMLQAALHQTDGRLVLLLDNLETVQDKNTRALTDRDLNAWLSACLTMGKDSPIVLLTSRWRIPGLKGNHYRHHPLGKPGYGDFLRYTQELFREKRDRTELQRLYDALGGNFKGLQFYTEFRALGVDESDFLTRLEGAQKELQAYMALEEILKHLTPPERELLNRTRVYKAPTPRDGVTKIASHLRDPLDLLQRLTAFSLMDVEMAPDLRLPQYSLSPLVGEWLEDHGEPLDLEVYRQAARYQLWILNHLRPTISQALVAHQALESAELKEEAHQVFLDYLIGYFDHKGMYQTLLDTWLPPLLESTSNQVKGNAFGYTGKILLHVGKFDEALVYLKQSLTIRREIGDRSGEGVVTIHSPVSKLLFAGNRRRSNSLTSGGNHLGNIIPMIYIPQPACLDDTQ